MYDNKSQLSLLLYDDKEVQCMTDALSWEINYV